MEFAREYDQMKNAFVKRLVKDARLHASEDTKAAVQRLRAAIAKSMDKCWYEAALEVIGQGDVYNPGKKSISPSKGDGRGHHLMIEFVFHTFLSRRPSKRPPIVHY